MQHPTDDKPIIEDIESSENTHSTRFEINSPLLECLVIYTKLNRQPYSKESLIAGLPKEPIWKPPLKNVKSKRFLT